MEETIRKIFPEHLRLALGECEGTERLEEIRIRIQQPVIFATGEGEYFLDEEEKEFTRNQEKAYCAGKEDLEQMLLFLSRYSIYAFEEEIRRGYITLEGGHRVGLAGQVVMEEGQVKTLRYINFMNIRVAREKKGCAEPVLPYLYQGEGIYNTLIVSPPGMGKTTYLRDTVRLLSNGNRERNGLRVCIIDERSEIAACHLGIPQNDVGMRTDVMDGCEKAEGMLMVLRAMSPQVIAVDELGGSRDFEAVEKVLYCGSRILGTIHAENVDELKKKPSLSDWTKKHMIERFVVLKKADNGSRFFEIYDGSLQRIC